MRSGTARLTNAAASPGEAAASGYWYRALVTFVFAL